jgi:hypothetical protein
MYRRVLPGLLGGSRQEWYCCSQKRLLNCTACKQALTDHPVLDLAAVASRKNAACTAGSETPGPQLQAVKTTHTQSGGRCYQDLLLCGTPHTGKPVFKQAYEAGRHVQSYYKDQVAQVALPKGLQQTAPGVMKVRLAADMCCLLCSAA